MLKKNLFTKQTLFLFIISVSLLSPLLLFYSVDFSTAAQFGYLRSSILSTSASIIGIIGGILLFWQVLLSSRRLMSFISKDVFWFEHWHKFFGKYGFLFILLHPILLFINSNYDTDLFFALPTTEYWQHVAFGRMALFGLILIWVTSALLRSKIKFRPWKYIHYLTYPIVILVLVHSKEIGNFLSTNLPLQIMWYLLACLVFVAILDRVLVWIGVFVPKYEITATKSVGKFIKIITLKPVSGAINQFVLGQHVYLQLGRFSQQHPYTIMDFNIDTKEITIGVREVGKFTKKIMQAQIGTKIFVSGPYGVFTLEAQNDEPKVFIAGGIGITPFWLIAQKFSKNSKFIYCNRLYQDVVYRSQLKNIFQENYFDILDSETIVDSSNTILGRLDVQTLQNILDESILKTNKFFVCGSPGFIDGMMVTLKKAGVRKDRIYYESLG